MQDTNEQTTKKPLSELRKKVFFSWDKNPKGGFFAYCGNYKEKEETWQGNSLHDDAKFEKVEAKAKPQARLYAPHIKAGKNWIRATRKDYGMSFGDTSHEREYPAYPKAKAVEIYQNWLLAPYTSDVQEIRELRPIKRKSE